MTRVQVDITEEGDVIRHRIIVGETQDAKKSEKERAKFLADGMAKFLEKLKRKVEARA